MTRGNQFFDIGVQGRKTGVFVPHQELDAFGFENPDGFFSPSPAPEKTSRPLDAFLTGAQGGSNSPALAAGHRGEVAVSGSGEESMDLDSGVDAAVSPQRLQPTTTTTTNTPRKNIPRPPFKSSIHMTTDSPNPLFSTPPRRAASIGPTSSGFTPVNLANTSPTRASSSTAATASTTQTLNRVLNFRSSAGGALQSPLITGQPPRRPRTPSAPPLAKSALQARQLNEKKELTVFSSPVGPEVGRGTVMERQSSESIGKGEEEVQGKMFAGKINGVGQGGVERAAEATTTAPAEKPTAISKTAQGYEATTSKPAPASTAKASAAHAKKKLLSSRPSIIPTKPPPPFSLPDGEEEQVTRPATAVGKAMRVPQVVEEVSITELDEDKDENEDVGVSGKKWKAKEKEKEKEKAKRRPLSQMQIKAKEKATEEVKKKAEQDKSGKGTGKAQGKGKGRARVSAVKQPEEDHIMEDEGEIGVGVVEEVEEEIEGGVVEEEEEEEEEEAPPIPQLAKNKKAPMAAPAKGRTSKAKSAPELVPVLTKSKATSKGRKAEAAPVEDDSQAEEIDEEEQVNEIIEEMAELEPEPEQTPQGEKLTKKAAAEAKAAKKAEEKQKAKEEEEAKAAKAAKAAKKKRGKKAPEPQPVEEIEVGNDAEQEAEDEGVSTPQPARRGRGAKSAPASSSSIPAPVPVKNRLGKKAAAAAMEEPTLKPTPPATKKTGRGGKRPSEPAPEPEASEAEVEPAPEPAATKKSRRGGKKPANAEAEPETRLSEMEPEPAPIKGVKTKSQGKGKSKAPPAVTPPAAPPLPATRSTKATKAISTKATSKSISSKRKANGDTEMLGAEDPAASQLVQEANDYYSEDDTDAFPPTKKSRRPKTTTTTTPPPPPKASSSKFAKPSKPTKLSQPPPRSVTPDLQQARPPQQKIHIIPLIAPVISPSDANKRRSSRARTAPLNYWMGSKVVTKIEERGDGGGKEIVKEVVLVEEAVVSRYKKSVVKGRSNSAGLAPSENKSKSKSVAGQKRKRESNKLTTVPEDGEPAAESPSASESSEEGDGASDFEPWELSTGSYTGLIKSRDGSGQLVESIIAYAPHSMTTNPVAGAMFRMNKTVSLDHLGTGIIDIPPGGVKRWKPSGKYDLVFYVVKGKVGVMVGENGFMCRRGGQFQVAKGNLYSIENQFSRSAKLFFVQGCEVAAAAPAAVST